MLKNGPRLSPVEEAALAKESFAEAIAQIRIVSIIFIVLFIADGLFGVKPLIFTSVFFEIRYYVMVPMLLIVAGLSYSRIFVKIGQALMIVVFFITGIGAATLLLMEPKSPFMLGILILVEMAGLLFVRLKSQAAIFVGLIIPLYYVVGAIEYNEATFTGLLPFLILLAGTVTIGIFGNYYTNDGARKSYLQQKQNAADKKHSERMMAEKVKEISDSQTVTIFALAKLSESRDKETGNHIERVGRYCYLIASRIENSEFEKRALNKDEFMGRIELASALHDIGKVGVGDAILVKPGKLNREEFETMTSHTLIGSNTLDEVRRKYPSNSFINMGIEITRCHHEKFDGTGYPFGLSGEQIPLSARIVAIADVYDALISVRPYKQAFTHDQAVNIIVNLSGQQFDPMLIRIFEQCNREIKGIAYGHQHPFPILQELDEED
jgi:HD-GYP domain-containing protein (c-di-GMP phosphodiesterase class II)